MAPVTPNIGMIHQTSALAALELIATRLDMRKSYSVPGNISQVTMVL